MRRRAIVEEAEGAGKAREAEGAEEDKLIGTYANLGGFDHASSTVTNVVA
jgi:hypothetical protein